MKITNRPNRRPDRQTVRLIAEQEAREAHTDVGAMLSMSRASYAALARRRAWIRILRETECSVSGLADVWGCDRQAIHKAISKPSPVASHGYDATTVSRLASCHGPDRARAILTGKDPATQTDVARWNSLGRRDAA